MSVLYCNAQLYKINKSYQSQDNVLNQCGKNKFQNKSPAPKVI